MKIDNVFVDVYDHQGMWQPQIKISGLGNSQKADGLIVEKDLPKTKYSAPEVLDENLPYTGEKLDVF